MSGYDLHLPLYDDAGTSDVYGKVVVEVSLADRTFFLQRFLRKHFRGLCL